VEDEIFFETTEVCRGSQHPTVVPTSAQVSRLGSKGNELVASSVNPEQSLQPVG
jgi:hypothetical protein